MTPSLPPLRLPLLASAILALLMALWAGLARLGWGLPLPHAALIQAHGPLMVCSFLGTLIGVERAVALGLRWPYVAPLLTGAGGLALLTGLPGAAALTTLGSLGVLATFCVIVSRQATLAASVMAVGAGLWCVGNSAWLTASPLFRAVPWWGGFLVLTIAGERLELGRVLRPSPVSQRLFLASTGVILVGVIVTLKQYDAGIRLYGAGLLALSLWLLRYDIARRTVRLQSITRFIAVCLLSGYGWLAVSGALSIIYGGVVAGPLYDAALHTLFLGFVVAMLFGHAPVIFPAVLGWAVPYHPRLYAPLVLLHASLCVRLLGDVGGWAHARLWGGLLNAVALVLFFAMMGYAMRRQTGA